MLSIDAANHYPLRITTILSATARGMAKGCYPKKRCGENIVLTTALGENSATTRRSSKPSRPRKYAVYVTAVLHESGPNSCSPQPPASLALSCTTTALHRDIASKAR